MASQRFFSSTIEEGLSLFDNDQIIPSGTQLMGAGIHIQNLKSGGTRGIYFESFYVRAYIYLPIWQVDYHLELIFQNLRSYEASKHFRRRNTGEISYYIRVMSNIIQQNEDVQLLPKRGIVEGNKSDLERLPRLLQRLSSQDTTTLNYQYDSLRCLIEEYSTPLTGYRRALNVIVILTIIQTFVAVLAYFWPPKA
ncbi:UNVERIFIED_CONTAM: hypothetical protein Slati_1032400 [Sesamum latifolium]|uniref:Uncharacterized protein n=1 Tax=Sesamum latifolium TaxID=2727402 RepID=A0AAW2XVK0_9LAMI